MEKKKNTKNEYIVDYTKDDWNYLFPGTAVEFMDRINL